MKVTTESIVAEIDKLPPISPAFARLSSILNDERTRAADIEEVLRLDPAMTANVLHIANSAYFSSSREISSMRAAITLLGSKRLFELASSAALAGVVPQRIPGYNMDAADFWRHSIAVAILAEKLSVALGLNAGGFIFTAGLLHDIGKLAIGTFVAEASDALFRQIREDAKSLVVAESDVLGANHAAAGSALAEKWNLPSPISSVIKWHHEPNTATEDQQIVDLVHIADGMAHSFGYGADAGELCRHIDTEAITRTGFDLQRLELVACETLEHIENLSTMFMQYIK